MIQTSKQLSTCCVTLSHTPNDKTTITYVTPSPFRNPRTGGADTVTCTRDVHGLYKVVTNSDFHAYSSYNWIYLHDQENYMTVSVFAIQKNN